MLTLHSIDHYINHPVVTLTTTSSPEILSYGAPSIEILIFDPFGGPTSWFAPRQLDLWTRAFGGVSPRNSYILTWRIWRWFQPHYNRGFPHPTGHCSSFITFPISTPARTVRQSSDSTDFSTFFFKIPIFLLTWRIWGEIFGLYRFFNIFLRISYLLTLRICFCFCFLF